MIHFDQLCAQAIKNGCASKLKDIQRGIEKEGLRVNHQTGAISHQPHPHCLGSALTHPRITTDYSEALLELITAPHLSTEAALEELNQTHQWVYQCLDNEVMWPGSMPSPIQGEQDIPIAEYGHSNSGKMKHIYRHGLAWRYGRIMQSIAGIHYNFSLPQSWWDCLYELSDKGESKQDFISDGYIALIRNFRRHAWLLTYLFGASPALDKSFFEGKAHNMEEIGSDTVFSPYATCLRMTDLGYKSEAQSSIFVCYNHLDSYTNSLHKAMHQPYPSYQDIGLKVEGEYRQLNTNLLQIENEFYSEIRPKRAPERGEKALTALKNKGIEYIEVRLLDLNPYLPLGIDSVQTRFIDTFLLHCLLSPSPEVSAEECAQLDKNLYNTALNGRDPDHKIQIQGKDRLLTDVAAELLKDMQSSARLLDQIKNKDIYTDALTQQSQKIRNIDMLPSQKLLNQLKQGKQSYTQIMLELAAQHAAQFKEDVSEASKQEHRQLSQESHQAQHDIEASDTLSFDDYLKNYFAN